MTTHPISTSPIKIWLYNSGHYKEKVFWYATYKYSGVQFTILQLYVPEFLHCRSQISSGYTPKFLLCVLEVFRSVSHRSAGVRPTALTVWCQKSYKVFLGNRLVYVPEVFWSVFQKPWIFVSPFSAAAGSTAPIFQLYLCLQKWFHATKTSAWPQDKFPLLITFCCCLFDHSTTPVHADSPFYG